jgi:triacylglycerol esterase/lipase EstA (alpha/beta hydrolase family)
MRSVQALKLLVIVLLLDGFACSHDDGHVEGTTPSAQLIKRANSAKVLVFVHGLFGSLDGTWRNPNSRAFLPELLLDDPRLRGFDAYVIGFQTPYIGKAANIEELTQSIYQRMVDDGVFGKYSEVYFVGHSLGGLIAEAIVVNLNRPEAVDTVKLIKAVVTIATPAQGSPMAALADYISENPQLRRRSSGQAFM